MPFLALFLLSSFQLSADDVSEYRLKAEMIERFTRFIDWPDSELDSDFVIGVIGRDPFGPYLDRLIEDRAIKGRVAAVRRIQGLDDLESCDIVFISSSERQKLDTILTLTSPRPILTIGDTTGFGEAGVLINFFVQNDKIRFEINEGAARRSGLRISSKLYKLATIVGSEVP